MTSISNQQIEQIKNQLLQQIDSSQQISEEQKPVIKEQIQNMNKEQLIEFLKQNKLIQSEEDLQQISQSTENQDSQSTETQCIFCNISNKKIPSVVLKENEKAIAILELNPISKGHALIIPKEHISSAENIPPEMTNLSKEIDDLIKQNLSPKNTLIDITSIMEHVAINIVPVYNNETLESPRTKSAPEQLQEIKKQVIPETENSKQTSSEIHKAPQPKTECPFCSIVSDSIQAYKIDENKDSLAVLEINPISRGHVIVIPKKHLSSTSELPATAFSLAKKISKKINSKLKPKDVIINSSTTQTNHAIINIIPVYNQETTETKRYKAETSDLEQLKEILEKKSRTAKKTASKKTSKKSSKKTSSKEQETKGHYSGGSHMPNRIP